MSKEEVDSYTPAYLRPTSNTSGRKMLREEELAQGARAIDPPGPRTLQVDTNLGTRPDRLRKLSQSLPPSQLKETDDRRLFSELRGPPSIPGAMFDAWGEKEVRPRTAPQLKLETPSRTKRPEAKSRPKSARSARITPNPIGGVSNRVGIGR